MIRNFVIRWSALATAVYLVYMNPDFLGGFTPFVTLLLAVLVFADLFFTPFGSGLETVGPHG